MFPPINKSPVKQIDREQAVLIRSMNTSSSKQQHQAAPRKIWMDEKPPESIELVYKSIEHRLSEIEAQIGALDADYGILGQNLFVYMREASFHVSRLCRAIGLDQIRSARVVRDVFKIIKFNADVCKRLSDARHEKESMLEADEEADIQRFIRSNNRDDDNNDTTTDNNNNTNNECNNIEPISIVVDGPATPTAVETTQASVNKASETSVEDAEAAVAATVATTVVVAKKSDPLRLVVASDSAEVGKKRSRFEGRDDTEEQKKLSGPGGRDDDDHDGDDDSTAGGESDEDENDEHVSLETRAKKLSENKSMINIKHSLNYLRQRSVVRTLPIELIRSDPVITPIVRALKMNIIWVDATIEHDTAYLRRMYERMGDALAAYARLIDDIEALLATNKKYLRSFIEESYDYLCDSSSSSGSHKVSVNEHINMDVSISAGGNGGGGDLAHTRLLLDSALKYESARVNYYNLIKRKVRALKKLTTTFYNEDTSSSSSSSEAAATGAGGAGGVQMKDFGHDALQLSRRYECADYQVVLVVPEHSMQTRRCVETLREWLEYDRAYAKYHLPIDMVEIDKRRKSLNSIKSSTELIYTQLVYRLHLLKAPIEANEREMQEMYRKKDTTSTTTTTTTAATATATATSRMTMAVFADSSSYQQHKHATSRYASMECRQMLDEMNRELDKWEHEEVKINRAILALKPKQYMKINEIFIHIERVKSAVWWLDEQLVHLYQEKKVKQNDLDILDNCYLRLKEIHINKMSSEALGKIFYGLPMPTFKLNSTSNNCGNKEAATAVDSDYALALVFSKHFDPFDVYFKIVARGVSTHETWIRIYFELPFHPERGQENKQKDIDDLYKVNRSSSCRELCYEALRKWKRLHSRAKVENLHEALRSCGRHDLIDEFEERTRQYNRKITINEKHSVTESDMRKREAEIVHQNLTKFFEQHKAANAGEHKKHSNKRLFYIDNRKLPPPN